MYKFLSLLFVLFSYNCLAQQCDTNFFAPDSLQLIADGSITAHVKSGDTAYIAGDFHAIGRPTGQFFAIDKINGMPVNQAIWPKVAGEVRVALKDGNGGWIIGGLFTKVGDSLRQNLAWIDSNLNVLPWNPVTNEMVISAVLTDTVLYIGGAFTSINNTPRTYFGALSLDMAATLRPLQFNLDGSIHSMALYNDKLWIGGIFNQINSQTRSNLTAINLSNATLIPQTTNLYDEPTVLRYVNNMIIKDGNLYASGIFRGMQSPLDGSAIPRTRLLSLDADNGTLRSWQAIPSTTMMSPTVTGLDTIGNNLLIVGYFTSMNNEPREGIALVDCSSAIVQSFNNTVNPAIYVFGRTPVTHDDSTIYIGNAYQYNSSWSLNGPPPVFRYGLMAIDKTTGSLKQFNPIIAPLLNREEKLQLLINQDNKLFLGGSLPFAGGKIKHRVAAVNLKEGSLTDFESGLFTGNSASDKMKNRIISAEIGENNLYIGSYQLGPQDTSTVLAGCNRFSGSPLQLPPLWTNGISRADHIQYYDGKVYAHVTDYYQYLVRFNPQTQVFDNNWSINLFDLNQEAQGFFRIRNGLIHSLTAMNGNRYFRLYDINTRAYVGPGIQTFSNNISPTSLNDMQFIGNKAIITGRYNYLHNPFINSQDYRFGIGIVDSGSLGYQTNPAILDEYTGHQAMGPEYYGISTFADKYYSIRWMRWPSEPGTDATPRVYDTLGNRHFTNWKTNFELTAGTSLLALNKDTVYAFSNVPHTAFHNIIRFHLQQSLPNYSIQLNANPQPAQHGAIINFDLVIPYTGTGATFAWYKNGQLLPGVAGSQWSALAGIDVQNGDLIAVKATDSFTCTGIGTATDQLFVQIDTVTNIRNTNFPAGFYCYPNPAKDYVNIKGLQKGDAIECLDLLGRKMYHATISHPEAIFTIPVRTWENGVYFFRFKRNAQEWQTKVIKSE